MEIKVILNYAILLLINRSKSSFINEANKQEFTYNKITNYSSWITEKVIINYYYNEKCINFIDLNENDNDLSLKLLKIHFLFKLHELNNKTIILHVINNNYISFLKSNCNFYCFLFKNHVNFNKVWLKYVPLYIKSSYKLQLLFINSNILNANEDSYKKSTTYYENLFNTLFAHADVKVIDRFTFYSIQSNQSLKAITDFSNNGDLSIERNVISGKHLQATTFNCHPFSYLNENNLKTNKTNKYVSIKKNTIIQKMCGGSIQTNCVTGDGIFAEMMVIMANNLNFTWSVVIPLSGHYGAILPNGTVDGCEGDIVSGNADIGYCDFWVHLPRHNKVEFTYPLLPLCMTFLVPRPKRLSYAWYSVFMSFKSSIWIIIIILIFLTSGILNLFNVIHRECTLYPTRNTNFLNALFNVYGLLITAGQFGLKRHNFISIRLLLTWWSLMTILITLMYSCNLVSFLTIPKYEARIDSAEVFQKASLYWGLNVMIEMESLNLNRKGAPYIKDNVVMEYELNDRLENLKTEKYAVLVYRMGREMTILCGFDDIPTKNLRLMKDCLYEPYTSMILPKNSPYQNSIDNFLLRMFDVGIFQHVVQSQIRKHVPISMKSVFKERDVIDSDSDKPVMLTFEHVQGAFFFLIFFNLISTVIFLREILYLN